MSSTSPKKTKLTRIFLFWLSLILMVSFAGTLVFTWRFQTKVAEENTVRLLKNTVDNITVALKISAQNNEISYDDVADYYAERIGDLGAGGVLVIRDGIVIGDAVVDSLGKPVAEIGIQDGEITGSEGHFSAEVEGEQSLCYYETQAGLTVLVFIPEDYEYAMPRLSSVSLSLSYMLLLVLLFMGVYLLLKVFVLKELTGVNSSLTRITEGDLDEQVNARGNREFDQLSEGINTMVTSLKGAISREATRIDEELSYARQIQMAALPKLEMWRDNVGVSVAASIKPAREVGGDFYDFFTLPNGRVCLVIADVSGKGIPAALYMMSAMDKVRRAIESETDLAQSFYEVNNVLCESSDEMFVTLFAAVLEPVTGRLIMVNAGHNTPLIYRKGEGFHFLTEKHDFILGGMEKMTYHCHELTLAQGDLLFTYTDGVTECMDEAGNLYGNEGLAKLLNDNTEKSPQDLLTIVEEELATFAGVAEQADDITMLAVKLEAQDLTADDGQYE